MPGSMKHHEITEELKEKYIKEVTRERPQRTLEDALREALENTTPEFPGTPNYDTERREDTDNAEWI